ncbi:hypothetical protein PVNG_05676 [Plasmodium vivax North Korean]|uniref:Variable surface protein n=1 Tax=Plasmodium vivax North Korean TaxID=1035514 RepID=A0A0J9TTS1_PLAVI|nr:hypothetical protein PVNG_05676 [Plasmodium vivax North Korean]
MSIIKNIHIRENFRFLFFLNIFAMIILIWIYNPHNDVYTDGRTIENKIGSSLNICLKRYLTEYEVQKELDRTVLYKNTEYDNDNKRTNIYNDYISIYSNMKNRDSRKLKLYKTGYKHRYSKKKGLAKLDCYCEKKIFDIFGKVETLSENMQHNRKSLKRILYKRLGLPLLLLVLLPFNVIFFRIILNEIYNSDKYCFSDCSKHGKRGDHVNEYTLIMFSKSEMNALKIFNNFMLYTLFIIVLLILIYILIKVIKYEKLKSGKSKMNIKEYCYFCKDIFV